MDDGEEISENNMKRIVGAGVWGWGHFWRDCSPRVFIKIEMMEI